ncbi:NAD(P)H-hydrate epimerase [Brachymonas sp.]|uniref:NAD(P)H-hydrate epimerase n=1 Tax=Brachymonas sp. TaxID=1936292 RepID=UPI0035B05005
MSSEPCFPPPLRVTAGDALQQLPLHDVAGTRTIEAQGLATVPPRTLMRRAGMAVARVALAIAPHAQRIWIACGPGNNGGDGLQAAACLRQAGKNVQITLLAEPDRLPSDARGAWEDARAAGVAFVDAAPALTPGDLCIDALLGIGAQRPPAGRMLDSILGLQHAPCPVLAIDVPTGLHPDTGTWLDDAAQGTHAVHAQHTLTMLTLKPGFFTGHGRDACGQVWWDGLGICRQGPADAHAVAYLQGACLNGKSHSSSASAALLPPYASHKGSFGDVCVAGGARGMTGAALLAGSAALHAGAGRVYVGLLTSDRRATDAALSLQPELMIRSIGETPGAGVASACPWTTSTVVLGCGGGEAVAAWTETVCLTAPRLVLDADGLNAVAGSDVLQEAVRSRLERDQVTILTPHPTEAARLLKSNTAAVQADRLGAAQQLGERLQAVVVLKGSGTVVWAPAVSPEPTSVPMRSNAHLCMPLLHRHLPLVHLAGNARLSTAGTGDVLAGCIAGYWAQLTSSVDTHSTPACALSAACRASSLGVQAHGSVADGWALSETLTAGAVARHIPRLHVGA